MLPRVAVATNPVAYATRLAISFDPRIGVRDGTDKKLWVEGRALFPDNDLKLQLSLTKTDVGFVRGGFEQWRRYYDDTGGFYRPFSQPAFNLNRDLSLDVGRAWIDFGLTPPHGPQVILGYEVQYKEGAKSTLE